jgi:glycosyltransferase involved in cell wall biosynthesis
MSKNLKNNKFESYLFLPKSKKYKRFGEGGLRKKNIFKKSISNKPLISIVTTNLNDELERTILSVIDQKNENIEFIIKDGGSKKRTIDILKYYDNEIDYWVSENDNGIWDGTNKGVTLAKGDYIVLLDSGDIFNSNALSHINSLIRKNPNADFYLGSCLKKRLMHGFRPKDITFHFNIFASFSGALFASKYAYKKIGLYNTKAVSADHDFLYKAIVKHKIIGVCGYKNNILSIKAPGGFSDNYPFLKTLCDECKIRFNNKQNLLIVLLIFFGRIFTKLLYNVRNYDGNIKKNSFIPKNSKNAINKARNYYENIINRQIFKS